MRADYHGRSCHGEAPSWSEWGPGPATIHESGAIKMNEDFLRNSSAGY